MDRRGNQCRGSPIHRFDHEFTSENSLLSRLAIAEAIGFIAVLVLLFLLPSNLDWLSLAIALVGISATLLVLGYLHLQYQQLPIVAEKRGLLADRNQHQSNLKETQKEIVQADRERKSIRRREERAIEQRESAHESLLGDIARRRRKAENDEKEEVDDKLQHLQERHLDEGLRRTPVDPDGIRGVGKKMVQRLRDHGIQRADDVTVAKVQAIPGFGEAKAAAVAEWRSNVERNLRATAPQRLPDELGRGIRKRYQSNRDSLDREETKEHEDFKADLASIRDRARSEQITNSEAEERAREEAQGYEAELAEADDALEPYEEITYLNYLREAITQPVEGSARPKLAAVGIGAGIVAGLVCQTTAGLASVGSIYLASLPTVTPTPSPTATSTPTATATDTLTPTATSTASSTPTLTATFTPSMTPTPSDTPTPTATLPSIDAAACIPAGTKREVASVVDVVDGDTIDVIIGDTPYKVRYIGIDTPERGEEFGFEALRKNRQLVRGQTVTLVKDVSETDQYDRLLRYVLVGDQFVNYELVRQGLASSSTYPPDVACQDTFVGAGQLARAGFRGLWQPTQVPTSTRNIVVVTAVPGEDGGGNCSSSYPGVCIPPPPPDLNCGDIAYGNFIVQGSDPHHFDGDNDGIGCE